MKNEILHGVHKLSHPLICLVAKSLDKREIIILHNRLEESKYKDIDSVIYACNHTNSGDMPTNILALKKQYYVVAGDEIKNDINGVLFKLNGVVWIDRTSKNSKNNAKEEIINHLNNNHNILIFPEATWNVTKSNLMLPLYKGVIDASIKTGTLIVPVAIEYLQDKRIVNIGKPYYPNINNNVYEEVSILRDKMATLRWEIWESLGIYKRDDIPSDYYEKYLAKIYGDYPKLVPEDEKNYIRKEYVTEEEVFEPIRRIRKK